VARSIDGLKEVLLCELNNRTKNIGIIYKGEMTQNDFTLVCEEVFNCDTYLKACIESYTSTIRTNNSFEMVLKEGESISLIDDKISPELYEDMYQWSTSDPDLATVSNGIITAEKAATIVISAQPMYDMLSTVSLYFRVHVIPVDSEDGKTPQVL